MTSAFLRSPLIRLLTLLCSLLSLSHVAHAQRIALVIGNAQYQSEKALRNPSNDADLIADVLRNDLKFDEVIVRKNLGRRDLSRTISELAAKAKGADAVVVYYSGHGMQRGGQNYLLPVDASIQQESDIDIEGIASSKLLGELENANPKVTVVILDACRDNPYSTRTKSSSKGLARMGDVSEGVLVAYATRDGSTADDGGGNNSPYAMALAKQLKRTDQPIRLAFEQVADDVKTSTANKQRPITYGDLKSSVYLSPFGKVPANTTNNASKPEPLTTSNRPGQTSGLNLDDLEKEETTRKEWNEWQARMKADYDKIGKFSGSADLQMKAWDRFLSGWAENNAFSQEDENLRALAQSQRRLAERTLQTAVQNQQNNQTVANTSSTISNSASTGHTFKDCDTCATMVVIPASNGIASFSLGQTEVTQAQWQAVMGNNPSHFVTCGADCPVEKVSWDNVQEFINKLNAKTGNTYRLPSEQEWEYACLAGQKTEYCGANDVDAVAWIKTNSNDKKHAARGKQANAFGLYDMSGNVYEWTDSCYEGNCAQRVIRGGSWDDNPQSARAAFRNRVTSAGRIGNLGFRVARTAP